MRSAFSPFGPAVFKYPFPAARLFFSCSCDASDSSIMAIFKLDTHVPEVDSTAWIAPGAQVIGQVTIGPDAGIWQGAVLRGDLEPIRVGRGSNIQDNAVLHTEADAPCVVGEDVTVGHGAILHGCTVGNGALIGMGATVLNRAVIGDDAVVGAGALVPEDKTVPARTLVVGCPARVVRTLTDGEVARNRANSRHYVEEIERYKNGLEQIG